MHPKVRVGVPYIALFVAYVDVFAWLCARKHHGEPTCAILCPCARRRPLTVSCEQIAGRVLAILFFAAFTSAVPFPRTQGDSTQRGLWQHATKRIESLLQTGALNHHPLTSHPLAVNQFITIVCHYLRYSTTIAA